MHAAKFTSNRAWHGTKSEALYATMHNGQLRASSDRKAWKALLKWCAPSLWGKLLSGHLAIVQCLAAEHGADVHGHGMVLNGGWSRFAGQSEPPIDVISSSSKVYVKIRITMWNQLVHRFPQIETSPPDNP